MKFTWNPLYKMYIGEDGKMYTPLEKAHYELKELGWNIGRTTK